jgi:hypothetical protein
MLFAAPGQVILAAQERKSRLLMLAKQPSKVAHPAAVQLIAWFQALDRRLRKTITFDNGTEFAQHHILTDKLGIRTFFCDPHSPWQKGTIEKRHRTDAPALTTQDQPQRYRQRNPQGLRRRLQQHSKKMPRFLVSRRDIPQTVALQM